MIKVLSRSVWAACAAAVFALASSGCGDTAGSGSKTAASGGKPADGQVADKKGHDHSGWWCDEHGIPEAECSMCSAKVAKAAKAKGDWCDKHDRAKSQCFICDPTLKEKFAAQYRAKYGKEPPAVEAEGEKKDDAKGKDGEKKDEKPGEKK